MSSATSATRTAPGSGPSTADDGIHTNAAGAAAVARALVDRSRSLATPRVEYRPAPVDELSTRRAPKQASKGDAVSHRSFEDNPAHSPLGTLAGDGPRLRETPEGLAALGHELSLAIARAESAELAIADVLRSVCDRTGWALGQAWVRTPDGRALECSPAWHAAAPGLESFRRVTEALSFLPGIGLPGKAWEAARPVWVRDVKADPGFERGLFAQDAGLAAGIAVPVLARDEVVAVMEFFLWEEREEDERLVALVSAVAAQLGTLFQQKQAEEALRASEEHFRAVADTAADAILSLDPQGNIAYANAAASRIFGHGARELSGRPVTDVLPGGVPAATSTSPTASSRWWVCAAGGESPVEFPLEAAFSQWSAGGQTFTTAVLRDITARKRDQAAVHEAEERFRGAFEEAPIGMALVSIESDRAGVFLRVNRALCDIIGYSPEDLVGVGFESIVDPSDEDSSDARYVPWMLAGEVRNFEVEKRLRRADGETIVAMVSVSLVPDAQSARST